jgi:hypothetical protein
MIDLDILEERIVKCDCKCKYDAHLDRNLVSLVNTNEEKRLSHTCIHIEDGKTPKVYMLWCIFHEEEDPQYHNMQDMYGEPAYLKCDREPTERLLKKALEVLVSRHELPKQYRQAEIVWEREPKKHR